jgi:hypothetical protein
VIGLRDSFLFLFLFLFTFILFLISRKKSVSDFFSSHYFFEQQEHSVTAKVEKFFAENRGRNAFSNANSWAVSVELKNALVESIDLLGDFQISRSIVDCFCKLLRWFLINEKPGWSRVEWRFNVHVRRSRIWSSTIQDFHDNFSTITDLWFSPDGCSIEDKIAVTTDSLTSSHLTPLMCPFDLFSVNFPATNVNFVLVKAMWK